MDVRMDGGDGEMEKQKIAEDGWIRCTGAVSMPRLPLWSLCLP